LIPKIIIIILLTIAVSSSYGQGWVVDENNFETNWNFTFQYGRTALLSEVTKDFSGSSNDMNNQSDWGFNLQIAKMVWDQVDLGFEFGVSNYKGYKNFSGNVNWLMLHSTFNNTSNDYQPFPIYYDSDVTNFSFYIKYNFINFSTFTRGYLKLNIYSKLAVGLLLPSVEMGFKDKANYEFTGLSHPLYLKGRYPSPQKDSHFIVSPALGLNYQLSERFFLSAETSFQLIGADNIDGIHNFSTELSPDVTNSITPDYRIDVYDLTAKFMVGVTYFFNFDTHKQQREKDLPWFENRYRSYYSKFHKQTTQKDRQDRLPFYHDQFKSEK
jgi:hypothetical protein